MEFLRHIETSLGHSGGVDTPSGTVPAPEIWAKLSKYMREGEDSISTSIRAPCTKFCLEVSEINRNISDHLGGVDPPVGRVLVSNNQAKLSKYFGEGEGNISTSIRAPCTKYFLEISETHRNNPRSLVRC